MNLITSDVYRGFYVPWNPPLLIPCNMSLTLAPKTHSYNAYIDVVRWYFLPPWYHRGLIRDLEWEADSACLFPLVPQTVTRPHFRLVIPSTRTTIHSSTRRYRDHQRVKPIATCADMPNPCSSLGVAPRGVFCFKGKIYIWTVITTFQKRFF